MSWRIVVVSKRCKLDLSMNYMVVRGEDIKRVSLNEIAVLILENNAVSMTGCLLSANVLYICQYGIYRTDYVLTTENFPEKLILMQSIPSP